jgi:hypothetical protein
VCARVERPPGRLRIAPAARPEVPCRIVINGVLGFASARTDHADGQCPGPAIGKLAQAAGATFAVARPSTAAMRRRPSPDSATSLGSSASRST